MRAEPDLAGFGDQHAALFASLSPSLFFIAFVIYASLDCSRLVNAQDFSHRILMLAHLQGVSDRGLTPRLFYAS